MCRSLMDRLLGYSEAEVERREAIEKSSKEPIRDPLMAIAIKAYHDSEAFRMKTMERAADILNDEELHLAIEKSNE